MAHPKSFDSNTRRDGAGRDKSALSVKKVRQLSTKPTTRYVDSDIRLKKDIETA
ncbi:hypothetical protein [Nocardia sp. NPDC019395]|uniref:hypothetical protein n=1 Tax=Nocardia sp. NPDC019395 TaxID=3154686 RepID=UPI0033D325B3